jgi:hypothetical protein
LLPPALVVHVDASPKIFARLESGDAFFDVCIDSSS